MRNLKTTESERALIRELGSKGMPDVEIARQMNISQGIVSFITTKYWKQKMKEKDE